MENNSTADKNCEQIYENVGDVDNIDARKVKIVHISDTHLLHEQYVKDLPDGDILVHSGDFNKLSLLKLFTQRLNSTFLNAIETINDFFASVPHKYKIFVAGNHEISFVGRNRTLIREHLSNCIYLHNSSVRVMGVNFYGAPFTTYRFGSFADAFVQKPDELKHVWSAVPENTDVVVTHGPPQNILDLGQKSVKTNLFSSHYVLCDVCGNSHPDDIHYGCRYLKETIFNRVRYGCN